MVWLDEIEDLLEGADPTVVGLWKWHLLEEYEHRTVCHDVFHRLSGGYFRRVYGLVYQMVHLTSYSKRVRKYLLAEDRKSMSPAEIKESIARERAAARKIRNLTLPRLLRALSPFYTPRKVPEPKMYRSYMAGVEAKLSP
jgi:predicted metal-dependent hydrolase